MEKNIQNKGKFISQYWGQKVLTRPHCGRKKWIIGDEVSIHAITFEKCYDYKYYLELKDIFSITDEHAQKVAEIFGLGHLLGAVRELVLSIFKVSIHESGNTSSVNGINNWLHVFDYLRSEGYAVPWMGMSIAKLVEYGWIKIV